MARSLIDIAGEGGDDLKAAGAQKEASAVINKMDLIPASSGEAVPLSAAQEAISSPSNATIPQGKNGVNTQHMQDAMNSAPIDSTLKTEYNEGRGERYDERGNRQVVSTEWVSEAGRVVPQRGIYGRTDSRDYPRQLEPQQRKALSNAGISDFGLEMVKNHEDRGEHYGTAKATGIDTGRNSIPNGEAGVRARPTQSNYSERGRLLAGRHSGSTGISVISNEDSGEYNGRIDIGAAFRGARPRGTGSGEADVRGTRRNPAGNQRIFRQHIINQAECS